MEVSSSSVEGVKEPPHRGLGGSTVGRLLSVIRKVFNDERR